MRCHYNQTDGSVACRRTTTCARMCCFVYCAVHDVVDMTKCVNNYILAYEFLTISFHPYMHSILCNFISIPKAIERQKNEKKKNSSGKYGMA